MRPTSLVWKILELYGTRVRHRGKNRLHSLLRSAFRVDGDFDLEVERRGLRWLLNPSDFVQTHLYWTAEYEPWDLRELSGRVSDDSVVLDIGANFGYYSLCLGSQIQGAGHVFAFEPCEATFSRLRTNIALNHLQGKIEALPYGLSDKPGKAFLDETAGNSGAATLSDRANGVSVTLDTLDNFCVKQGLRRVDLVKIDVEGSEFQVIQGARKTLAQYRPVLMIEFNEDALQRAGTSVEQLQNALADLDYRLFIAERNGLSPFRLHSKGPTVLNVFCLPSEVQSSRLR
jgi:FkbM family methyltransferase